MPSPTTAPYELRSAAAKLTSFIQASSPRLLGSQPRRACPQAQSRFRKERIRRVLTRPTQENGQAAALFRIPFLAYLLFDRLAACRRRTKDAAPRKFPIDPLID